MQVQLDLKSNGGVELIAIGEASARLGLTASALRYYDERGLVRPSARPGGHRMYGPEQLRRLAFIKIAHRLGLPPETAAAVFDAQWREIVSQQIAELDEVITQARGAQEFLTHALHCPTDHPARQCVTMITAPDRVVEGLPVDKLAAEHGVQTGRGNAETVRETPADAAARNDADTP